MAEAAGSRQLAAMRQQLDAYHGGGVELSALISNLEALQDLLETVPNRWRNSFREKWGVVEELYSVAICGGLFMLGGTLTNAATLIRYVVWGRQGSMIPVVGGLAGCGAVLAIPVQSIHPYWWVPLVADPGCALLAVLEIWERLRSRRAD